MGDHAEWDIDNEITSYREYYPKGYRKNRKENPNYGKDPQKGITDWIDAQYLPGSGKNTAYETRAQRIMRKYATEVLNTPNAKYRTIAKEISTNHWGAFIKWVKETYK